MKNWVRAIIPPHQWKLPVIILSGIFLGFLFYSVYVSNFVSYLSDSPETCVNCHIMAPQYATWSHSAHREVANCNDCHVPHNNFINKYYFKAKDGLRHATIFTLRREPQVILIREAGINVVQKNCIRCHEHTIQNNLVLSKVGKDCCFDETRLCWECHRETPHGRINSISSVPYARVPLLPSPVPDWLKKVVLKEKNKQNP
jgi:cytochrome c nitrite reductase small subunit